MRRRPPKLCFHKPTGQYYVRLKGKPFYLGTDEIEAEERRREFLADWFSQEGDPTRFRLTLDDLCLLYMKHVRQHYRKNGEPTSEVRNIQVALRPLVRLFGRMPAREFGPKKLKKVRDAMIEAGCVRTSINRQVGRIKRLYKWATAEELVPVEVYQALTTVAGLKAGRSSAEESNPVCPVAEDAISAVKPYVSRPVWAMIQLQLFTGMRPGEVVALRGRDLNMSGRVWEYIPKSHKTEHHGKQRVIFIGPRAQEVVRNFLRTDLTAYLFSPAEAREEYDAQRRANRKTPLTPSQGARKRKLKPRKSPGHRYTVSSYGQAIRKACEKAFGMPTELQNVRQALAKTTDISDAELEELKTQLEQEASAWREENCWHPNQLRHNAATMLRRELGIEAARVVLGHASASITEIYAEVDLDKARQAIEQLG